MAEYFGQDLILLEKIASGGMAEVYRSKQYGYSGFEKTVAVKRILQSFAENDEFKQMFRFEANLSASLQHPNIAQIFLNGEHDGFLYLVLEFVDGKNVRQMLARADKKKLKIPIEISLFIVAEVAKGLDYAHNFHDEKTGESLDIVHRDMSPQNIMLSYDGSVKVVDFGIAKAAARSGQTRAGVLKGKFGYMSPEQAKGMPVDRRTDLFALGIILFELVTQRRLFTADDDLRTLQLVKECRIPRPSKYNPDVSPALDSIVLKALQRERADRYTTGADFYAEVTRLLYQQHADFLPTDLSKFLREIFSEDIVEEKKKREKINANLPARPDSLGSRDRASALASALASSPPEMKPERKPEDKAQNMSNATEIVGQAPTETANHDELFGKQSETDTEKSYPKFQMPLPPLPTSNNAGLPSSVLERGASQNQSLPGISEFSRYRSVTNGGIPLPGVSATARTNRTKVATDSGNSRTWVVRGLIAIVFLGLGAGYFLNLKDESLPVEEAIVYDTPVADANVASVQTSDPANPADIQGDQSGDAQGGEGTDGKVREPAAVTDPSQKPPPSEPIPPVVIAPPVQVEAPTPTPNSSTPTNEVGSRRPSALAIAPNSPEGFLKISALPPARKIYLNGELLVDSKGEPLASPQEKLAVVPGSYTLVLENAFYNIKYSSKVVIQADRIVPIDAVLK